MIEYIGIGIGLYSSQFLTNVWGNK